MDLRRIRKKLLRGYKNMENFALKVMGASVKEGEVGVFFLGQAGFVLKTCSGELIAIDPYLSDCCERYFGFKRLMPHILGADEIIFDYLVASHAHFDHFDPDSVPVLLGNGKTKFVGAKDTRAECERLGIKDNLTFVAVGDKVELGAVTLTAVRCDHGKDTPDAIGLLFEAAGKKIYMMGDTAYRPEWLEDEKIKGVDLLILPINGAFGNLNSTEAARVVKALSPKLAVPCHYWNFAEHFGSPYEFMTEMKNNCPEIPYLLMRQGEMITLK